MNWWIKRRLGIYHTFEKILDQATFCIYFSLHWVSFAGTGWPIDYNVAILSLEKWITEFFSAAIENIHLRALISVNFLKVKVPFAIIEVMIGEYFETLLVIANFNDLRLMRFLFEQRPHSCTHFNEHSWIITSGFRRVYLTCLFCHRTGLNGC